MAGDGKTVFAAELFAEGFWATSFWVGDESPGGGTVTQRRAPAAWPYRGKTRFEKGVPVVEVPPPAEVPEAPAEIVAPATAPAKIERPAPPGRVVMAPAVPEPAARPRAPQAPDPILALQTQIVLRQRREREVAQALAVQQAKAEAEQIRAMQDEEDAIIALLL